MAAGLSVAKTLINIIAITKRKKMRKRRNHWYWVYWANGWSWNDENGIDFRWSDVQEDEEDIAWLTSLKITKVN